MTPQVYPSKHFSQNDSYNQTVQEEEMEIEMLKVIGKALKYIIGYYGNWGRSFLSICWKQKVGIST